MVVQLLVLGVLYYMQQLSQTSTMWSMKELRLTMTNDELPKDGNAMYGFKFNRAILGVLYIYIYILKPNRDDCIKSLIASNLILCNINLFIHLSCP
jgi:hypothetical protein